jgi:hypothetical protein
MLPFSIYLTYNFFCLFYIWSWPKTGQKRPKAEYRKTEKTEDNMVSISRWPKFSITRKPDQANRTNQTPGQICRTNKQCEQKLHQNISWTIKRNVERSPNLFPLKQELTVQNRKKVRSHPRCTYWCPDFSAMRSSLTMSLLMFSFRQEQTYSNDWLGKKLGAVRRKLKHYWEFVVKWKRKPISISHSISSFDLERSSPREK